MTYAKTLQDQLAEFDEKYNYASFTWNGDNATGVKFAKNTKRQIKHFLTSFAEKIAQSVREYTSEEIYATIEKVYGKEMSQVLRSENNNRV